MVRDIYLHGAVGRQFGHHFRLDVISPAEAWRALFVLRPKLRAYVRDRLWRIVVGPPSLDNAIEPEMVGMNMGNQPMHVVPITNPRGGSTGKIIVGVVLVGAAIILSGGTLAAPLAGMSGVAFSVAGAGITFGNIAMLGVSMILVGVAGMLAQSPVQEKGGEAQARPGDAPSYLFNGVKNNSQQGGPVPLVYGEHLTGSIVINGSIATEDIPV